MSRIVIPFGPYRGEAGGRKKHEEYTAFAADLQALQATLRSKMGGRDWCYHLEEHGLVKPDFDKAEKRLGNARKWGYLPVDFMLEDDTRKPDGNHGLGGDYSLERELEWVWDYQIQGRIDGYCPIDWVDYQPYYIELLVEKRGLANLFTEVAKEFHFNVSNGRGDTDIISVANMHRRFQEAQDRGQQPVLLYCGDFDPKGVAISELLPKRFADGVGRFFEDGTELKPINLKMDRFGLNLETIDELTLSKIPNLLTGAKAPFMCTDGKRRIVGLDNPLHPDHMKPYVQDYLKMTGGEVFKVEANALMVRQDDGIELLRETVAPYIDQDGLEAYESDLEDAREALAEALPDFLREKLSA